MLQQDLKVISIKINICFYFYFNQLTNIWIHHIFKEFIVMMKEKKQQEILRLNVKFIIYLGDADAPFDIPVLSSLIKFLYPC